MEGIASLLANQRAPVQSPMATVRLVRAPSVSPQAALAPSPSVRQAQLVPRTADNAPFRRLVGAAVKPTPTFGSLTVVP